MTALVARAESTARKSVPRRLSVLVVTNMYPTDESPHYGTFVAEQVQALAERDDIDHVDVLFVDGRKSPLNYVRGIRLLRRVLSDGSYDVVHAHHGLAGAVAVTQSRLPVVITFHGSDLSYYRWQKWISRWAARRAKVNVCVSSLVVDKIRPAGVHLPCGLDLGRFAPRDRAEARRRLGVPEGDLALLFPGPRHHPQKAYHRFAEIRDELRARGVGVHELRLEQIDRPLVPELYSAADVLVLTSVSEGTPVSIMEALAGGVPVVATNVGDVPAMLAGVPNCFVGPYDRDRFVEAIQSMVQTGARVPAARSRRFAQERIVSGLLELYTEAIAS